jgi:hypothetical protein
MNYMRERGFRPLTRSNEIGPNEEFDDNVFTNIPLYIEFESNMRNIHTNRPADQWKTYYSHLPDIDDTSHNVFGSADQEAADWMPVELPNHPTWEKRGYHVTDTNMAMNETKMHRAGYQFQYHLRTYQKSRGFYHSKVVDAGWNFARICWNVNPHRTLSRSSELIYGDNPRNESDDDDEYKEYRRHEQLTHPYAWWLAHDKYDTQRKEPRPLPPPIKRANIDDILFEHWITNPPILERQERVDDGAYEQHSWVDERLEWLSITVEEPDNEAKDQETFGV